MSAPRLTLLGLVGVCLVSSCGGRPSYWDKPVNTSGPTYGLHGGVAVVDDVDHRVVLLTGTADQQLTTQSFPIGHNFASAATSADGSTLFVLSSGDQPVQTSSDQLPSLTVIQLAASTFQATSKSYSMSEPLSNLAIDPMGAFAVAYQGAGASTSFAQNPNEIVIFDLGRGFVPEKASSPTQPPNPVSRSIRSFGGTPQQLTFSPSLNLPANISADEAMAGVTAKARRLLIIETNIDVSIVDLTHAFDPPASSSAPFGRAEITVRLTSGTGAASLRPTGLVVDSNPDDGRIAFFTTSDTNVYSLQLIPAPAGSPNDFTPQINLTPVGAPPSDIQFVRTLDGLRIAALVPTMSTAVLIEPVMSVTTQVALASAYSSMSLVTNVVSGPPSTPAKGAPPTDVALLWGSGNGAALASGVALWTLGTAVGQAYRSIEVLQIAAPIQAVIDVPAPNDHLKVLATQANQGSSSFYVLDLVQRTANPIQTTSSALLTIAPDGLRMWAYDQGTDLASIDFTTLNPTPLTTDAPISVVYDVTNPVSAGGGRSLIAINALGTLGATVFDALNPVASARQDVALLLEGP